MSVLELQTMPVEDADEPTVDGAQARGSALSVTLCAEPVQSSRGSGLSVLLC